MSNEELYRAIFLIVFKLGLAALGLWMLALYLRWVFRIEPKAKTKAAKGTCSICNQKLGRYDGGHNFTKNGPLVCDNCYRLQDRIIGA